MFSNRTECSSANTPAIKNQRLCANNFPNIMEVQPPYIISYCSGSLFKCSYSGQDLFNCALLQRFHAVFFRVLLDRKHRRLINNEGANGVIKLKNFKDADAHNISGIVARRASFSFQKCLLSIREPEITHVLRLRLVGRFALLAYLSYQALGNNPIYRVRDKWRYCPAL